MIKTTEIYQKPLLTDEEAAVERKNAHYGGVSSSLGYHPHKLRTKPHLQAEAELDEEFKEMLHELYLLHRASSIYTCDRRSTTPYWLY